MRYLTVIFFLILSSTSLHAQQTRIWIDGKVLSADSLLPINNVHIISRMARSGTISEPNGHFLLRGFEKDSVFFSAVGFQRAIIPFDISRLEEGASWNILLKKDTVQMEEVVVRSFYDWPTFKHLFVNMQPIKPVNLDYINNELKDILLYVRPAPFTIKGPIQTLYDLFNDVARLQRRLERNRHAYNEQLIKEGRQSEVIPDVPEHKK
ncbi:MAG: hypothetical protein CVT92_02010 [Bacteroidetes bacterium HGW-Bacteroidetes-1]|nr:MAG: hypothetical protein CVT92_02010 [Bacteroidetes bacterium HGW-Bacteroidetes-1]